MKDATRVIETVNRAFQGKARKRKMKNSDFAYTCGNSGKTKEHHTEIFEYIRRRKAGKTYKVGIVWGGITDSDGTVRVGWSKCNYKAKDKFDFAVGKELAFRRACGHTGETTPVPLCLKKQVRQFGARCVRYFKDSSKIVLPV